MTSLSEFFDRHNRLLLAIASAGETSAVLKALNQTQEAPGDWRVLHFESFSILQTGVGKSNAAGAVSQELTTAGMNDRQYAGVLSFGIAGSLKSSLPIGSTVFASSAVLADEGTPFINDCDWTSLQTSGWAQTNFDSARTDWAEFLQKGADHSGIIATISTISGTDEVAKDYVSRTGALAEGMEGAAIAQVCLRFGVPFAEYRVISNSCGNRNINKLDIPTSFRRMKEVVQSWRFESAFKAEISAS